MKLSKLIIMLVLVITAVSFSPLYAQYSYNYEEMEMDEYNALLAEWKGRLEKAQKEIAAVDAQITDTQAQIDATQAEIDGLWADIYAALEKTNADDKAFGQEIAALRADAAALLALSPEEIYARRDELNALKDRLAALRANNLSYISGNTSALDEIESLLNQAEEKGKPAEPDTYTVNRGDYLWKIAKMSDIYGDAYAWSRIYTSNKDQIKDPNMIFPAQVFRIPRDVGPNEHLVARGEFLSKIAGYGNVFGDPFKWQRLYEANKDVVSDPNMIYPYQVLNIPRN
jgi:nucleoid-associated protein YgaU